MSVAVIINGCLLRDERRRAKAEGTIYTPRIQEKFIRSNTARIQLSFYSLNILRAADARM